MITIEQITKKYGPQTALEPLSLSIASGSCVALCGGNGAGKSTLLHMMAGTLHADGGTISGLTSNSTGFMPDAIHVPPGVSARRWLFYLADLKGCDRGEVDSVLTMTGLTHAADKEPAAFSRGMLQRLLFAQMMLGNPDILLMDEPGNGLDPFWVEEWKQQVLTCREQGKTIVFSSHLLHDVLAVADRIILLHEGRLIVDEPAEAWKQDTRTPEQRFLDLLRA
ncbi:ABC transporter ATP-binding protein [Aneurinibacillus uraniidurans]|uniref:ABC transporter ATP-binding protein n=1 Tax=Aneurinibacillus uraniidurans TaxID=2966586 RepID=UPI00234BBF74|nr:ABC transporter ATP-binding protein [Aneurinibacillus sp. B1]WCN38375.1 ABC transporter ATP-binding protein [Aneurinibacillus sp. B1]